MNKPLKVSEFGEARALVEVYQKIVETSQKTFFDVVCASECIEGTTRYLYPLVRLPSVPYLVVAVMEAMTYISDRHKEIREADREPSTPLEQSQRVIRFLDEPSEDFKVKYETVKEFKSGSVIGELLLSDDNGTQVFNVCCWREFTNGGSRVRDFFIQQRDLRNLVIVLMRTWIYFQENWGARSPVEGRRW